MKQFYNSIITTTIALSIICMPLHGMNLEKSIINLHSLNYKSELQRLEKKALESLDSLNNLYKISSKNKNFLSQEKELCSQASQNLLDLDNYIKQTDKSIKLDESKRLKDFKTIHTALNNQYFYELSRHNKLQIDQWQNILKIATQITINNYMSIAQGHVSVESGLQAYFLAKEYIQWSDIPENQISYIEQQQWSVISKTFLLQFLWEEAKNTNNKQRTEFAKALQKIEQNCPVTVYLTKTNKRVCYIQSPLEFITTFAFKDLNKDFAQFIREKIYPLAYDELMAIKENLNNKLQNNEKINLEEYQHYLKILTCIKSYTTDVDLFKNIAHLINKTENNIFEIEEAINAVNESIQQIKQRDKEQEERLKKEKLENIHTNLLNIEQKSFTAQFDIIVTASKELDTIEYSRNKGIVNITRNTVFNELVNDCDDFNVLIRCVELCKKYPDLIVNNQETAEQKINQKLQSINSLFTFLTTDNIQRIFDHKFYDKILLKFKDIFEKNYIYEINIAKNFANVEHYRNQCPIYFKNYKSTIQLLKKLLTNNEHNEQNIKIIQQLIKDYNSKIKELSTAIFKSFVSNDEISKNQNEEQIKDNIRSMFGHSVSADCITDIGNEIVEMVKEKCDEMQENIKEEQRKRKEKDEKKENEEQKHTRIKKEQEKIEKEEKEKQKNNNRPYSYPVYSLKPLFLGFWNLLSYLKFW